MRLIFLSILLVLALGSFASGESPQEDGAGTGNQAAAGPVPEQGASFSEEYISRSRAELEPPIPLVSTENPWEARKEWGHDETGRGYQDYQELMDLIWAQYLEDLNYSSYILDEYVRGNITGREAMTTTVSLFVMTSQTVDMVSGIEPPTGLSGENDIALQALVNLEGYLWNMAKFYETGSRAYAAAAHESFNASIGYYEGKSGQVSPKSTLDGV